MHGPLPDSNATCTGRSGFAAMGQATRRSDDGAATAMCIFLIHPAVSSCNATCSELNLIAVMVTTGRVRPRSPRGESGRLGFSECDDFFQVCDATCQLAEPQPNFWRR